MRLGSIDLSDLGTLNPILMFAMPTSYVGRFDPYRTKVLIDVVILLHENVPLAQSQSSWVAERTMGIAGRHKEPTVMEIGVTTPFVTAAVWILLFRKFPSWVSFFRLSGKLPTPLNKLWSGWTDCPYCGGFWVALLVRYLTGLRFLRLNGISPIVDWSLDALTVGFVTLLLIRTSDALAVAAGG